MHYTITALLSKVVLCSVPESVPRCSPLVGPWTLISPVECPWTLISQLDQCLLSPGVWTLLYTEDIYRNQLKPWIVSQIYYITHCTFCILLIALMAPISFSLVSSSQAAISGWLILSLCIYSGIFFSFFVILFYQIYVLWNIKNFWQTVLSIFNRPGVAGAVLKTDPSSVRLTLRGSNVILPADTI